ncbi:MAG: hypothetical protein NC548_63760 [Lachnospiraceae bacterium]|nr:hypothetical protein [Lachnospiraceae bacterium]
MSVIYNPIPNITLKELKKIYKNRKANHLENCNWKNYLKKYKAVERR